MVMTLGQGPQAVGEVQLKDAEAAALLQKIASGDRTALAVFYEKTARLLFGLVARILGGRASTEEVLLDVYTQVWKQSSSYDPNRHAPLAWLVTIARTRAIVRLRSGKHQIREWGFPSGNPEEMTVTPERQKLVRSAIESLAPEQRQVLDLAYYSGASCTEIATQLGQPLGAIKTRARFAMIKLSELFRPVLEHGHEQQDT